MDGVFNLIQRISYRNVLTPIHIYWGNDEAARQRAINALVEQIVDPAWAAMSLSPLDGNDPA